MSWDLWGPPDNQVELECSNLVQPRFDFYAGFGVDVIDEDALNEMSCVQVLRILIAKADAEIDELEQHLVSLECQLAWEEHEEFYHICCDALREKIDYLDTSLRSIRSTAGNCANGTSGMRGEPAERTHVILKALLNNYYQKNQEAVKTVTGTSNLDAQDTSVSNSNRELEKTDPDSKTASKEALVQMTHAMVLNLLEMPPFQQPADVIVEFNTQNVLEKTLEPEYDILGDSIVQPATIDTILNLRDDMESSMRAETQEMWGLSFGKEGKRDDEKSHLTSILQLQDQGSNISESLSHEKEDQLADLALLNDATVTEESKWGRQLLEQRPESKRKVELDSLGAEKSLFPCEKILSIISKAKVARSFSTRNNSFIEPSRERMGKKMVLALSALPPNEKGELNQTSKETRNESIYQNSSSSQEQGVDDMLNNGLPMTGLDNLHKQLVGLPSSAEGVNLEDLKVIDLRAIAKGKKLKQYYKLSKKLLVEKIASSPDTC